MYWFDKFDMSIDLRIEFLKSEADKFRKIIEDAKDAEDEDY